MPSPGLALALALILSATAPPLPPPTVIPAVRGILLSGQELDLPHALPHHSAVLVFGFSQSSRAEVADWGRRLAADYSQSPTVLYFELPVLASVPRFLRPLVVHQIKASVPDPAQAHCLPLADHEEEWKRLTGFAQPGDAYILLVDSNGLTRWNAHGPLTGSAYAQLQRQLALLAQR